jgi:hypothetical protein
VQAVPHLVAQSAAGIMNRNTAPTRSSGRPRSCASRFPVGFASGRLLTFDVNANISPDRPEYDRMPHPMMLSMNPSEVHFVPPAPMC